jgi:peptidoglycan/LPS O-acetylase OafA/YrhL
VSSHVLDSAPAVTGSEQARSAPSAPDATPKSRLAWLDALRGMAALCVVYEHWGARVLPSVHRVVFSVFDPGLYGVLVFFLISGYIVPASLERTGSLRTFWISRVFRLFPLFAVVIAVAIAMRMLGLPGVASPSQNVAASVFGNLFMLNDLLGQPNIVVVVWTLSYEMVFYLLVTALFTVGLHRRSCGLAVSFATGAVLLGGLLPTVWLSGHFIGPTAVALTGDLLIIGGLIVAVTTRGLPQVAGAWLAGLTGLSLVVFNEHKFAYEGLAIFALMFTGTVLYRAQHGQVSRRWAAAVTVCVFGAVAAAGAWHIPALTSSSQPALEQRQWIMSVALAGLTLAAGLRLKNLRVPRLLAWLGLVSYSVYLLFPLLLDLYDSIPLPQVYQNDAWLQVAASGLFLAALLACAAATYRLVEVPMQRLGRRLSKRLDNRSRPDGPRRPLRGQPCSATLVQRYAWPFKIAAS